MVKKATEMLQLCSS